MRKSQDYIRVEIEAGPEIEALLSQKVYEYNARATGYFDVESFSAVRRNSSDTIAAGICGYTWGGCCYISYLWVDESERGRGVGTRLVNAAEEHAISKGCLRMLLSTHSFQAPGFYRRLGYEQQAVVCDHPLGHASLFFAKDLATRNA